jgi:hypothetical protein
VSLCVAGILKKRGPASPSGLLNSLGVAQDRAEPVERRRQEVERLLSSPCSELSRHIQRTREVTKQIATFTSQSRKLRAMLLLWA